MSNGGIQRIRIKQVKQYYNVFEKEYKYFSDTTYNTFKSSYIKRCSDGYISQLASKLTIPYETLEKGYKKIADWWNDYNEAIESLETSLSQDNRSYVSEASTNSYVQSKLQKLENYKNVLSREINPNIAKTSSPVFENNTVITNVDVTDSIASSVSNDSSNVRQQIDNTDIYESMNASIDTGADMYVSTSVLSDKVVEQSNNVSGFFKSLYETGADIIENVKSKLNSLIIRALYGSQELEAGYFKSVCELLFQNNYSTENLEKLYNSGDLIFEYQLVNGQAVISGILLSDKSSISVTDDYLVIEKENGSRWQYGELYNYVKDVSGRVLKLTKDNQLIAIYNNEIGNVNIFDDFAQCGGDQMYFSKCNSEVVNDSKYLQLLQEYFPDATLEDVEAFAYALTNVGCGYVAHANAIFKAFEGNEGAFLETFGYPMYKVNNDGSLEPNISYLVFELVAHCHTGPGADLQKIYGNSVEVEHQDQSQGEVGFNGLMRGLQAGMVGIIQAFAEKHGISSEVVLDNKTIKVRESLDTYYKYVEQGYDVFLTVQGFTLYEYDPVNNVALDNKLYESAGGHAMSIIGITEDGRYVVSSWGKEFVCDLSNTDSVVFPSFNIIKYQTSAEQSTSKRVFIDSSIEESDIGIGKVSTLFKEVTSATEAISEPITDTSTGSAEITDVKSLWQKFKAWINNDIKKSDVSFKVVDENYNNQLSSMTSELESYEELYNTYIDKYNEAINELSIYQNELKTAKAMLMSGAGMPYAAISQNGQNNYNKVMSQIIKEYGSYDNYKDKIDSLKGELSTFETALDEIKKQKELLKYGCLEYASEFENYIYNDNINYEEIAFFDEDMCAMSYYNEDTDGNPLQYMKAAINNLEHPENIIYNNLPEYDQKLFNLIELSKIDPSLEKTYNFLYEKYGLEVANKYLNDTESMVNNILGQKYATEFLESLNNVTDEKEIGKLVANHIKTSGKGLGKGLESFGEGISNSLNAILAMFTDYKPSTSYTVGEYETMYIVQALQNQDYGKGLVSNYEISQGIGNMLPSILLQSNWLMGLSAAGNSYHSSLVEGYSNLESLTYGLISGSSEAILEKFLGGLPGVGKDIKVSNVKSFLSAIASEGIEEGVQTITDAHVRQLLFSENIDPSQLSEDVIKSIKYGMITAGIMQGGAYSIKGLSGINQMANNVEQNVTDIQNSSDQKTFAEQINEVNYHSTKGDLLSYTFELNSIDEVTSELLNKIVDPSIVKFKIGDQIYDYIDIKKACLQNPEPILNNTEVQHITSFEKLPEALKQYLSNLLKNENGDFMSVKRLSDIFANAYENGDISTKKIVENFPFLSEILNISYLDSLSSGASAFFASDMLFGDKKAVIHNEVGFGNDIVFSHEIGHALLQMVDGIKLPENYNSVMENLLKNWQANPEQLESFLETARARQEDIWSRVKETTSEWMDANSSDIDKRINEVINDKAKLEEELRNSAKRNFVSNSRIDEEVQKLMSDNDLNQISDYIKKSYGTERMWSDFIYECDADSTMKIYRIVLGLIDSAYNGNNPYYSTFYDNGFLRSHDKDYFSKDKNSSFNEQFADFVSIKLADIPEAYQITKMLFGEEWINMMEGKYSQIANNMEEKINNYSPGSIDDLFNLDDLMLFNESVFKRVGDFFGKNMGIDVINNNKSSAQNLSESKILSKTFAEQINEANYYSAKGNLLSYTFELNSIDEVTTELLNKIIDPSVVKFKIGDEIYSYIDMKAELGLISPEWSHRVNINDNLFDAILSGEISALLGKADIEDYYKPIDFDQLYTIMHTNFDNVIGSNKVNEILYSINVVDTQNWQQLLDSRGLPTGTLGFVDRNDNLFLPSNASMHTAVHEVLHKISSWKGNKVYDAFGNIKNVTGLREFYNNGLNTNITNERITEYFASKLFDDKIYNSQYDDGTNLNLIERLDNLLAYAYKDLNILLNSYVMNDNSILSDFFSKYSTQANYYQFVYALNSEINEYTEYLNSVISELENRFYPKKNTFIDTVLSIFKKQVNHEYGIVSNKQQVLKKVCDPVNNYSNLDSVVTWFFENDGLNHSRPYNLFVSSIGKGYYKDKPSVSQVERFLNRFNNSNGYYVENQAHYFTHVFSSASHFNNGGTVSNRLYINAEHGDAYKFVEIFADKCESMGIPFYFKVANFEDMNMVPEISLTRDESVVIYAEDRFLADYVNICNEIKKENPSFRFYQPPIFTGNIDGFIGYGGESSDHSTSYNSIRSNIMTNAIKEATNYFQQIDPNFNFFEMKKNWDYYSKYLDYIYQYIKYNSKSMGIDPNNFSFTIN